MDYNHCMSTEKQRAQEGVTLVSYNCRWRNGVLKMAHKDFPSLETAVAHANNSIGTPGFCDPIVVAKADGTKLLWDFRFGHYA
jgi:hypothetical protein